jgi:hypothetical protein
MSLLASRSTTPAPTKLMTTNAIVPIDDDEGLSYTTPSIAAFILDSAEQRHMTHNHSTTAMLTSMSKVNTKTYLN